MKPFLYLDNWHERQAPNRVDGSLMASGLPIERYATNAMEFPTHTQFCGAYVSPSFDGAYDDKDWIHREHEVLADLAATGMPIFGLCFGSQILASALCGRDQVFRRESPEAGFAPIEIAESAATDQICAGLPRKVDVFHWHWDEVKSGHRDIVVLASTPACRNQIWRHRTRPVWGVQPHPEIDQAQGREWLERCRPKLEKAGLDADRMIAASTDTSASGRLIENFIAVVRREAAA